VKKRRSPMNLFGALVSIIMIIGFSLIINMIIVTLKTKATIEWKVTRTLTTIFLALFFWAVYRFLNRYPNINLYDYLILLLNSGLFTIGYFTSKHILY